MAAQAQFVMVGGFGLAPNQDWEPNRNLKCKTTLLYAASTINTSSTRKGSEMKSDGSTASYYELPNGCTQLQDLISHRDMNAQIGEIFRACYRYGQADHSDKLRDAKKIAFYAQAEVERLENLNSVDPEDWIEWNGWDQCPVNSMNFVEIRLRGVAGTETGRAMSFSWKVHGENIGDIIAYRKIIPKA
jgi:hypothetical protein